MYILNINHSKFSFHLSRCHDHYKRLDILWNQICLSGIDNDNINQAMNNMMSTYQGKIEMITTKGYEFVHVKHETPHFL
jgi:hypothetical protein